jgi:hypothetical protein
VTPSQLDSESVRVVVREVIRVYERYAHEVVERFDLCPWAARARREGAAVPQVLLGDDPDDFSASLRAIEALAARPHVSVGLLIYPCFGFGRRDFEHFVRRLRQADAERHEPGAIPFAMAAFHPQAEPDLDDAERLVPFLRRSPDPTLQLVRCDALAAVHAAASSGTSLAQVWMMSADGMSKPEQLGVRERIARNNLTTVCRVGSAALEATLADIERDRAESYARLGLPARGALP